jgi:hypothetical protein
MSIRIEIAKKEISLIIKKKLKIQKTKTLLKKAIEINMSIKEHLVKFSIKDMIKTVAAKIVVLRRRLEHWKVPRGLSFF